MQRIGRVNRIGTSATQIFNYVFYPSAQGDSQIKLAKTALMKIQAFHAAFGEDNQIFSTEEIMDESKLFSGDYKEAEDERLKYLHELRQFKKDNKSWFEQIKKLPMKSRTGRDIKFIKPPKAKQDTLINTTVAFLKTAHKLEFYHVLSNGVQGLQPLEITPLEAFKLFKAEQTEPCKPLIDEHHSQVQLALNHFEQVEQDYALERYEPTALGVKALRVKKYLADLAKLPLANEKQLDHIKKLVALIEIGHYTSLPTAIDKLIKSKVLPAQALIGIDKMQLNIT